MYFCVVNTFKLIMSIEKKETERLTEEAFGLIDQSALIPEEKENLKRNIEHFMSIVKNHKHLAGCKWAWFDEKEDGHGLDLVWEWEDVNGVFGFYTDNGHGFSFEFGPKGTSCWFGGEGGDYGFSCGLFVRDLENQLNHMGYV